MYVGVRGKKETSEENMCVCVCMFACAYACACACVRRHRSIILHSMRRNVYVCTYVRMYVHMYIKYKSNERPI